LLSHRESGPNVGFIQIQHDASWRNVTVENWDKNRQEMLCQHLGFDETDANDISNHRSNVERDIATGDLICYNTQGIGTSCCVHLQMSAIEYNVDLPYVKCEYFLLGLFVFQYLFVYPSICLYSRKVTTANYMHDIQINLFVGWFVISAGYIKTIHNLVPRACDPREGT
jgi:hypothetical protein